MAKAKRNDDAAVKANDGAGKKAAESKTRVRKQAAEAKEAAAAEAAPEAAKAEKKAGGRKKAAVVVEVPPEPAKSKKKAGDRKAAEPVAEAAPEPVGKKKTAKAKVEKKAGGRKKAEEQPAAEPAGKKKTAKAKVDKKAGGRKKASEPAAEAAPEPAGKKAGKAKAKTAEPKSGKKKTGKAKKPAGPTLAERVDKHVLYQLAVQSPEADIGFFVDRYKELRGREPKVLREDFCGTAYISATWAASGKGRRAIGVDLDEATLQWAREHNLAPLSKDAKKRVDLRQTNVLDGGGEKADVTCAMNFSYGVFKTRAELLHYFEVVYQQLADDGVFVTELYGGTEAIVVVQDEREIEGNEESGGDFTYFWEQAAYNPITHETLCHIHFQLSDRSKIQKAFTYDWRLWSIMEVRELLYDVGFTSVRVYWESLDDDGEGTGDYHPSEKEENQEAWLVYLVAAK